MNENEPLTLTRKEWLIFELLKEGNSHKWLPLVAATIIYFYNKRNPAF